MDIYSIFIHNSQRCILVGEGINKPGTYRKWNIIQHYKEMSYQAMKRYGRNLKMHITY
jgi:hypothetical protein